MILFSFVCVRAQTKQKTAMGEGLIERAFKGEARVIDLTQKLNARAPTYGGERDSMRYEKLADIERDGYTLGAFRVPEHFGTHVDSPAHFLKGRETIDRIEARRFIAPAVVIDVRSRVTENPDYQLTSADIVRFERGGRVPEGAAVLLLTGWDERYRDAERYRNADKAGVLHFPGYSQEAIRHLLKRNIVALGIDTLSIDYGPSKDFAGHKVSHGGGLYHIENLTNLDKLPARGAAIFVGALPIEGGSGSPARVLAIAP
jgi:kynurenine formamidase